MINKRVVITGLGVIASNGIGRQAFSDALFKGISGIRPVSLFDTSALKAKTAGEITNFQPQEFLGPKGLRTLDRSTKLAASGTKLALDDASITITEENSPYIGVTLGTVLGSISSISDFDREALVDGARYVNPALFPNTVINSPASQVSIKFNISGFNSTISTGFCAGLDAINYAADFIRLGRAKIVLAGGVEELCVQIFLAFYKKGCLAGTDAANPEISCPFDKRRNGFIFGEGAAVLALEGLESARKRNACILAEVRGYGVNFGQGLSGSMRMAIEDAGLKEKDIDYISAAANSSPDSDRIESRAIKEVFGQGPDSVGVSSIKSMLGECFSASGSLQAASAVEAIQRQMVPPTINYKDKDGDCDLNYVVNTAKSCKIDNVLINCFGSGGFHSSLVISKFNG